MGVVPAMRNPRGRRVVIEDPAQELTAVGRVDRHLYRAEVCESQAGEDVVLGVVHHDRHDVAVTDPETSETRRVAADEVISLAERVRPVADQEPARVTIAPRLLRQQRTDYSVFDTGKDDLVHDS